MAELFVLCAVARHADRRTLPIWRELAVKYTLPPALRLERQGATATVILNRPEVRNALDTSTASALAGLFHQLDADPKVAAIVLTGADGHFCAGANLKEMSQGAAYAPWAASEQGPTAGLLSKPVIAAVAGHACAGGLGLAL